MLAQPVVCRIIHQLNIHGLRITLE